jgi:hypothetical protein
MDTSCHGRAAPAIHQLRHTRLHQRIRGSGSYGCAFPRHDIARVMHLARPSKDGGRRECRVQAAPMARLQQKMQAAVTTGKAGTTGIPCAMGLRLIACSPWCPGFDSHHPPGLEP